MNMSAISRRDYARSSFDNHAVAQPANYGTTTSTVSQLTLYQQMLANYAQLAARADAVSFTGNSLRTTIEQFQRSMANNAGAGGQGVTLDRIQADLLQEQTGILVTQYNRMVNSARPVNSRKVNDAFNGIALEKFAAAGIAGEKNATLSFNQEMFAVAIIPETATAESAGTMSALGGFAIAASKAAAAVINEVQDLTASATTRIGGLLQTAAREQLNQLAQNSLSSLTTINNSIANNLYGARGNETYSDALPPNRWALNNLSNLTATNNSLAGSLFDFLTGGNNFNSIQLNQLMFNSLTALNNAAAKNLLGAFGIGSNINSMA